MSGLTSIIIPTYNHGRYVGEAILSALAQTASVEVIVVDDGSTDNTRDVLGHDPLGFAVADQGNVRILHRDHEGPSKARNAGLELARGEFVMFLDADDIIAPTKVAEQLAELAAAPEAGWVLCDVEIRDDARGHVELASKRYNYAAREMNGWIDGMLEAANFIPIMSPLVRRSVLEAIRFVDTADGEPEDWRFWQRVARVARARYVPRVLATYRKRKTSRSRLPKSARAVYPNIEQPLRLNLGCGTPGTRSWHPIPGFVNLDKGLEPSWRFEDGLPMFEDRSVAGISVSHSLMYVASEAWPAVFAEFARVLVDGGVVRITEDDTSHPESRTYRRGWVGSESAVTLTSPAQVVDALERAGLVASVVTKDLSTYRDGSLRQSQHGEAPDVFFVEGQKVSSVLFAPHFDDETLFAAFTILRHRPHVVVCYPSARDYGETAVREAETRDAMSVLGAAGVECWAGGDLRAQMDVFDARRRPTRVWAPDVDSSHPEHVAVALAARQAFGDRVTSYHTYRDGQKVRSARPVPYEPAWVGQKLRALARYTSQHSHPRAHAFFLQDLQEFYGED